MTENKIDAGRSSWALRDIFYANVSALRRDFEIIDKKAYFWLRLLIAIAIALSAYSFQQVNQLSSAYIFAVLALSPLILLSVSQLFLATKVTDSFTGVFMPDSQSDLDDWMKDAKPDSGWEEMGVQQAESAWKAAKHVQVAVERKAAYLKTAEWLIVLSVPYSLVAGASACFGVAPFELLWGGGILALAFIVAFIVTFAGGTARLGRRFWNRLLGHSESL